MSGRRNTVNKIGSDTGTRSGGTYQQIPILNVIYIER